MRLTQRAHRLAFALMLLIGFTLGVLWPFVPMPG